MCNHINFVYGSKIPCSFQCIYLGDVNTQNWKKSDMRLLAILLIAIKKAITRKWLKVEPPSQEDCINIVNEIYITEKLSFTLRIHSDKFYEQRSK